MSGAPSEKRLRIITAAIALLGIAIATYVAITEFGGGSPVCPIGGGGGCETVAMSEYSHLAGINVAVIGIAGYALILGSALLRGDAGRLSGLILALTGFGFSVYLTYLELMVIDAICQWCVASAVLMTALFGVGAARAYLFLGAADQ